MRNVIVALACVLGCSSESGSASAADGGVDAAPSIDAPICINVDFSTDPHHCGSCGHDCLGGQCSGGHCQPVQILADAVFVPSAIAFDGQAVYWADPGNDVNQFLDGSIKKFTIGSSGGAIALASDQHHPVAIALDAMNVYWASGRTSDGVIRAVPKSGSAARTIASGQATPLSVAVDSDYVYWSTWGPTQTADGTIARAPLGGGASTVLASGRSRPDSVTVGSEYVYWTERTDLSNEQSLWRIPVSDGNASMLAATPTAGRGIALNEMFVFWTEIGDRNVTGSGRVKRLPVAGGAPTVVAMGVDVPAEPIVDRDYLYWTASAGVMKAPLTGGTPVIATQMAPVYLAQDEVSLCFFAYASRISALYSIYRIAK